LCGLCRQKEGRLNKLPTLKLLCPKGKIKKIENKSHMQVKVPQGEFLLEISCSRLDLLGSTFHRVSSSCTTKENGHKTKTVTDKRIQV
jgi:hypothetical protein